MKYIGKIFLYLAFIYIGYTVGESNPNSRYLYYAITVVVLLFNLFYDSLKYQHQAIMKQIANANNPQDTQDMITKLEQTDIFKGLSNSLIIPKLLLAIDQNNPNAALKIIKDNDKFLRSKPDYLLILKYNNFKAHSLLNNSKEALEAYSELIKLKESNIKSKHMSLLYSWDQIEALHLSTLKKYRQAASMYEAVNTKSYNPREKLHLNREMAVCYNKLKDSSKLNECIMKLTTLSPTSPFTLEWSKHETINRSSK